MDWNELIGNGLNGRLLMLLIDILLFCYSNACKYLYFKYTMIVFPVDIRMYLLLYPISFLLTVGDLPFNITYFRNFILNVFGLLAR